MKTLFSRALEYAKHVNGHSTGHALGSASDRQNLEDVLENLKSFPEDVQKIIVAGFPPQGFNTEGFVFNMRLAWKQALLNEARQRMPEDAFKKVSVSMHSDEKNAEGKSIYLRCKLPKACSIAANTLEGCFQENNEAIIKELEAGDQSTLVFEGSWKEAFKHLCDLMGEGVAETMDN